MNEEVPHLQRLTHTRTHPGESTSTYYTVARLLLLKHPYCARLSAAVSLHREEVGSVLQTKSLPVCSNDVVAYASLRWTAFHFPAVTV